MAQVKFFRGTRTNYNTDLSGTKQAEVKNGIYFITDEHCIMMNGIQYGGVDKTMFEGFIKDVDVEGNLLSFKKDVNGEWTNVSIELLKAADKSIVLGTIKNGEVSDGSTIKVNVKTIGDVDGLKLGDDGLYVDLTKTTTAITDEVNRATGVEQANATAIGKNTAAITTLNGAATVEGSVAKSVKDAIEALDVAQVGGTGKVITTVSETNGKIAATAIDLKAENVAFTPTTKVTGAVDVTGTTVTAAIASLAKSVKGTQNSAATYKVVKVTEGLATNVKEAYQLVQTINGKDTNIPVQIPIYKDQSLKNVELVEENDKKQKGQFMKYTYINADGGETIAYVDCSKLLAESEFKNGLAVSAAGEVSVKIDATSEGFLTVGEGGVKLANVQKAINDAKTELLGDAAADYNTLGKLEDQIQTLDNKVSKAHTEVAEKKTGHVTVSVADSTDGTHKVVTVNENDIASAATLTAETGRATGAEDKIEASVGLADDGSHKKTTGNYTSTATTVVGEIAALDTQVHTNADSIATVKSIANQNKQDIATIKSNLAVASAVAVKGSTYITVTSSIEGTDKHKVFTVAAKDLTTTTQHGELVTRVANTEKSITAEISRAQGAEKKIANDLTAEIDRAKTAETKALNDAKAYTDTALNWIEGGTY